MELNIFIGYDATETVAFHTLCHSIWEFATKPVAISPVRLSHLERVYTRDRHPLQSTEFSISRFMVPWMMGYKGWALFMDCDMMVRADISKVFEMANPSYSVMATKHWADHKEGVKMLGQQQTIYPKKNWSSFMLFNCEKCGVLTPEFVNRAEPLDLHRFNWLDSEEKVGPLPLEWNYLVGVQGHDECPNPSNVHWTLGGPWWWQYRDVPFAEEWFSMRSSMLDAGYEAQREFT